MERQVPVQPGPPLDPEVIEEPEGYPAPEGDDARMPYIYYRGGMSAATGKKTVEAEAKRLGVKVVWKELSGRTAGTYSGPGASINIDPDVRRMVAADARTVVRHEVGHYRITKTCGVVFPPIVGKRGENITDAYAHSFVGGLSYRGYGWNATDLAKAKKIKAGNCGQVVMTLPKAPITGKKQVNQYLYANVASISPGAKITYQWKLNGANIKGATKYYYLPPASAAGKNVSVTIKATRARYTSKSVTTGAVRIAAAPQPTSATARISGTANTDSTLSAVPSGFYTGTAFKYQWKANGANIGGATAKTYKIPASLVGKTITVTVTGTKAGYTTTAKTSAGVKVAARPQPTTATAKISGTAQTDASLTAVPSGFYTGTAFKYQWKANGANIAGATASTYKIPASLVGNTITVTVTGTKAGYTTTAKTSAGVKVAAVPQPSAATATISGTVRTDSVVTATPSGFYTGTTFTYQWKANGANIAGATGATYTVDGSLTGKSLTVTVTGTKAGYTTTAKTSAGVNVVAAAQPTAASVAITGTVNSESTVTALTSGFAAGTAFTYQWKADGVNIAGATGSTYKVPASMVGKTLTVTVTATKDGYTTTSKTSAGVRPLA